MSASQTYDKIYLASGISGRRELLDRIDIPYDMLLFRSGGARGPDKDLDDTPLPGEGADAYVERLAVNKANAGVLRVKWRHLPARPVLASETAIDLQGEIIRSPSTLSEAQAMLKKLAGQTHQVITAVALAGDNRDTISQVNISSISMHPLTDDEIQAYVRSGEPLGRVGGYSVTGQGAKLIEEIKGSHSGILGLPIHETTQLLLKFGFKL